MGLYTGDEDATERETLAQTNGSGNLAAFLASHHTKHKGRLYTWFVDLKNRQSMRRQNRSTVNSADVQAVSVFPHSLHADPQQRQVPFSIQQNQHHRAALVSVLEEAHEDRKRV